MEGRAAGGREIFQGMEPYLSSYLFHMHTCFAISSTGKEHASASSDGVA